MNSLVLWAQNNSNKLLVTTRLLVQVARSPWYKGFIYNCNKTVPLVFVSGAWFNIMIGGSYKETINNSVVIYLT